MANLVLYKYKKIYFIHASIPSYCIWLSIKSMLKAYLASLIFSLLIVSTVHKMNFEKNIWVYWENDIQSAPLLVKVSYEKLGYAAKNAGW